MSWSSTGEVEIEGYKHISDREILFIDDTFQTHLELFH